MYGGNALKRGEFLRLSTFATGTASLPTCTQARITQALGEIVEGSPLQQAAAQTPRAVKQLIADICLPLRLNELGVRDEHQLSMAGQAYQRSPHLANATLLSRDDTEAISVWRSSRATAASAAICLLQNLEG